MVLLLLHITGFELDNVDEKNIFEWTWLVGCGIVIHIFHKIMTWTRNMMWFLFHVMDELQSINIHLLNVKVAYVRSAKRSNLTSIDERIAEKSFMN